MRKINGIIAHCSDSDIAYHDSIKVIRHWHLARGFSDIGYHFLVSNNGQVHKGRPIEKPGAHCKGHNRYTIGICVSGRHVFPEVQLSAFALLTWELCLEYNLDIRAQVYPHNFFNKGKTCPNFVIKEALKDFCKLTEDYS